MRCFTARLVLIKRLSVISTRTQTEKALFLTRKTVRGANRGEGEESGREEGGGGGGCKRRSRRRRRRSRRRDYVKTKCGVS